MSRPDDRLRVLLSRTARSAVEQAAAAPGDGPHVDWVEAETLDALPPETFDAAFVSRDVTGRSTKHALEAPTDRFYTLLRENPALRWVHIHSAGADRPIYQELLARGVRVTTSAGANADVVAQTALAGVLALARRFPQFAAAQREHRWASLAGGALPRDLAGQRATVIGWGGIGQHLGRYLQMLGLGVSVVRSTAEPAGGGLETVAFEQLHALLPRTDWLLLACPLTERTRGLVDARALAALPPGAHLVNVARGEVVDEEALIEALRSGRLAGALLDVFAHEPLPAASPLWDLPNVIATPHSAGFSDANASRVQALFLDNLGRFRRAEPLLNEVRR